MLQLVSDEEGDLLGETDISETRYHGERTLKEPHYKGNYPPFRSLFFLKL